jgi:hypothetical protein
MRILEAWVLVLAACGTSHGGTETDDAARADESIADGGGVADAGAATGHGRVAPDASLSPCEAGLVEDRAHCIGWRPVNAPQECLMGRPALVRTEIELPWTEHRVLAVACEGEPHQLYWPDRDRWERATDVEGSPLEAMPSLAGAVAEAVMSDGTRVAVVGSVHAHPPYETWIKEPPAGETTVSGWRRSIDAPSAWVTQAAAITPDELLFVGGDALVFVRRPRAE